MTSSYLWPLKGGTWRERFTGEVLLVELAWLGISYYVLMWMLKN